MKNAKLYIKSLDEGLNNVRGQAKDLSIGKHLHWVHCKICLKSSQEQWRNQRYSKGRRNNSENDRDTIIRLFGTYIELVHPYVYQGAQHYYKIKSVPWVAKIILQQKRLRQNQYIIIMYEFICKMKDILTIKTVI